MTESHRNRLKHGDWRLISIPALVLCLVVLGVMPSGVIEAQRGAKPAAIDGYWKLTAEFPEYDLDSTVRFRTSADGRTVELVVLGPTSGQPSTVVGTMTGSQLSLTAPGPLGEMRVSLTYSDPTISGTWAAPDLTGQIRGTRMAPRKPEPNYYPKYFRWIGYRDFRQIAGLVLQEAVCVATAHDLHFASPRSRKDQKLESESG